MAVYRQIYLSFWTDKKVKDEFTPEDRYFYLYLLTNPATNLCGCYELSMRQTEADTGFNCEKLTNLLDRFENELGLIHYDGETGEVMIKNWYKYNWTKSGRFLSGVQQSISDIKSQKLQSLVLEVYAHL